MNDGKSVTGSGGVSYSVVAEAEDRVGDQVAGLWIVSGFNAGGDSLQARRYDWFYCKTPAQAQINLLVNAENGNYLGSLGVGLRDWYVDGARHTGGVLVDFMVHPEHRSAGPALALQRFARERALNAASMLYGLPEPKAVPIFKRLGANYQTRLSQYVRVLNFTVYLRRVLPGWLAIPTGVVLDVSNWLWMRSKILLCKSAGQWREEFDEQFDQLWERVSKRRSCIGVRDTSFLRWRFTRQPGHEYRIFAVAKCGAKDLHTYFVCEKDATYLVVKDCLSSGTERDRFDALVLLCEAARKLDFKAVSIQVVGDELLLAAMRRMHFSERSSRQFFATIAEAHRPQFDGACWYITPADEDV